MQINFELSISIHASEQKIHFSCLRIFSHEMKERCVREKERVWISNRTDFFLSEIQQLSFFSARYMCQMYQMDMNHWANTIIKYKKKTCRTISSDAEQILRLECEIKHVVRARAMCSISYLQIYVSATNYRSSVLHSLQNMNENTKAKWKNVNSIYDTEFKSSQRIYLASPPMPSSHTRCALYARLSAIAKCQFNNNKWMWVWSSWGN